MTGRKSNNFTARGNFNNGNKKPGMQNQNRNRMGNAKSSNFSNSLMNQVSPWLPQNNAGGLGNLGRNFGSDPQAQLALASNLLNNLLAPSSQLNKFAQPPSLLSLGGGSNTSSFGSSSFNRDRFGVPRSNFGKIQKRDDFKLVGKNKRFGDRKNQKKDQTNKKVTDQKNAEKKDVGKKEANKVEKTDVNQSVSGEGGENAHNDTPMEVTEKNGELKKTAVEEPKVSYNEIPSALLFCHICRKHMWDDSSFEKHLEGRPHKMMVEELDRSYKLKVALLRHEMRVMEQQRENDIQRAHRKGKSKVKMQHRGFCTMCDLSFLGMLPAHRKNERHQRLKKFLHPKCTPCNKEFYTRLEWDDHKLTANHLKKLAEIRKKYRPELAETEFDIIDFIDDINEEIEADLVDIKVTGKRETLNDLKDEKFLVSPTDNEEVEKDENITNEAKEETEKEEKSGTVKEGKNEGEEEEKPEFEKVDKDKEEEGNIKLPKYSPGIPVGLNFVVEKIGYLCRACNRFILSPEDSKSHCQTVIHYNNAVKILKIQNKIVYSKKRLNDVKNEEEEKADSINEIKEASEASEVEETNTVNDSICESEPKRRKLDDTMAEMNGSFSGDTPAEDGKSNEVKTEKYDPENAESESEKDNENMSESIEPELLLEDVKKEVIAEVLKAVVQATPECTQEDKKTPQTPRASARGQRARRGRRN